MFCSLVGGSLQDHIFLPGTCGSHLSVILSTQEAEIKRIAVQSQHGQIVHKTIPQSKTFTEKSWWSGSIVGPEFKPQYCLKKKKKDSIFMRPQQTFIIQHISYSLKQSLGFQKYRHISHSFIFFILVFLASISLFLPAWEVRPFSHMFFLYLNFNLQVK
jgi:hypothetical protein